MSCDNRWLVVLAVPMICALVTAGACWAQPAPRPDPSPLAPGDLKRPIFDTRTPVYDAKDQASKSASTVVAEVDGRAVTLGEVQDTIATLPPSVKDLPFANLFPAVLHKLVVQQALVIRAQRQGLDEDPVVRRSVKAASDQVMANAQLEHEISHSITEAELLDRYNKEFAGKPGPEEVHVRVIMVPTAEAASGIIKELRGGADFATLAKRSSEDATAPAGGDVGFVVREAMTPEVGAVVFSLPAGQFTPYPVRSAGAWFVLKVEERRQQPTLPFSAAREGLRQEMLHEGVADVVKAAMGDVTVREYDFTGKETEASEARSGSPESAAGHSK
jgi:peptidyl-prolyl cis-trans isomerase C